MLTCNLLTLKEVALKFQNIQKLKQIPFQVNMGKRVCEVTCITLWSI